MLSYIVGSLFILLGLVFLLYPETLRKRLRKKAVRKIKRYLFAAALFLGIMLISTGWKYEGILPVILAIAGVVVIFKGLFLLKSKASDRITEWILNQPVIYLKIAAVCHILLGLLIIFGLKN